MPCRWIPLVWKIEKMKREEKRTDYKKSADSDGDVHDNKNPRLISPGMN